MNENMVNRSYKVQVEGDSLGRYMVKAFDWMFAGLLVTFIVAVDFATVGTIFCIYSFRYWPPALLATELGVVIYLFARIEEMSVGTTRSLFSLYAALNSIVFSVYLLASNLEILWTMFGVTILLFGTMALTGWFGNINFTKLYPFILEGFVFLFFYWIFAMFTDLSALDTIISTVGIFLSLVLTVYDMKKIQTFHAYYGQVSKTTTKASILSAL